jgi:hypothetical protein
VAEDAAAGGGGRRRAAAALTRTLNAIRYMRADMMLFMCIKMCDDEIKMMMMSSASSRHFNLKF